LSNIFPIITIDRSARPDQNLRTALENPELLSNNLKLNQDSGRVFANLFKLSQTDIDQLKRTQGQNIQQSQWDALLRAIDFQQQQKLNKITNQDPESNGG
jgi:dTDP-4-dehydrorhamnose 3,5-epimerase-like enzyme